MLYLWLMNFYTINVDDAIKRLNSTAEGLSADQAEDRLAKYGKNIITVRGESIFKRLIEPFNSVFMLILVIATAISLVQKETLDAVIIASIIMVSAVIYYVQTFSTDRVLRALKKHNKELVKVARNQQIIVIDREYLVPGDVIYLSEGEKVPADARIMHAEELRCDESILTGESKPVIKQVHPLEDKKEIYEQSNTLFQGTYIIAGSTKALVVATGDNTEYGHLAKLSSVDKPSSPVQNKIDKLISQIILLITAAAAVALTLSLLRGISFSESLRFVLSLTVSAVPEGLPVAVSVVLVLGMRRMAKQRALIRTMSAIENIGTVTLIATDKTGTLTKNQLIVQDIWQLNDKDLKETCRIIRLAINSKDGVLHDPLDNALVEFAKKYDPEDLKDQPSKTLPFEISYAMSGNIWQKDNNYGLYIKGAPERVIEHCRLNTEESKEIQEAIFNLTSQGFRVIAIAYQERLRQSFNSFKDLHQTKMIFEALVAVADELRPESKDAIKDALNAGVKVCMITGDHFETAFAIGKKLGLAEHRSQVFDTRKMNNMTDNELLNIIQHTSVYSRVIPENKHKLLDLFKKHEIAAMTGDGVNDVPALTNAHIGIAMGSGSQIAKEAGEIVLLDDNFASIIGALKEGRQIYDNIRRMLFYLLATNLGEVMIAIGALILGMPLPLIAVQILWVNLVTDSCLVIPLGLEPSDTNVLKRPPRRANKAIIGRRSAARLFLIAFTMTIIGLCTFAYFLHNHSEAYARTIAFSVIVVMQWANAFNARSEWQLLFKRRLTFNLAFIIGLAIAVILQALAIFGPLKSALHVTVVDTMDLLIATLISFVIIIAVDEIFKLIYSPKNK